MDASVDLVLRARGGDRDAFAALYDDTSRPLHLYVLAIVGTTEDAEDAVHSAYLAAWQGLPGLRDAARFVPWLFRIGRNAARDLGRRVPRHDPMPAGLAARALDDAQPLTELLEGLDGETRALLTLRHGVGWSVEQIAAVTDASVATVRRRIARVEEHVRERERGRTIHVR